MSNKSYEMRCKIVEVSDVIEVGNNGFKKREMIGEIEGEYPEFYKFEVTGNKMDMLDDVLIGAYATITFNLRGKKVDGKKKTDPPMYFTTLNAWKVEP